MAIISKPFGGVKLTGADAETFLRQVAEGPTDEQRKIIAASLERGRQMVEAIERDGFARVPSTPSGE